MRDALVGYLGGLGPIGIVSTADLLPALLVGCYYIVRDARFRALDARPFLVLTLATGSLGRVASSSIRNGLPSPVFGSDTVTAEAEVIDVRHDKPIARLQCVARRQDGTEVLRGECLVYTMRPMDRSI